MKQLLILSLVFIVHPAVLQAQDKIYKSDGTVIEAKVIELRELSIKYKRASNPDGPTYTLRKDEIKTIIYENGDHEVFAERDNTSTSDFTSYDEEVPRSSREHTVVGIDHFQFYYRNIGTFVEKIRSSVYAMRIAFYINFDRDIDRPRFPIQYGIGAFPHFFLYNNEYVHVFIGPSFHHGVSRTVYDNVFINYYYTNSTERDWGWHTVILFEPGVSVNPVRNLDITFHSGPGFVASQTWGDRVSGVSKSINLAWKASITIGGKW